MSISESPKNINRRGLSWAMWLFGGAAILGLGDSIGLGLLFERVNQPAPIQIECSDEVLRGLEATSTPPIPKVSALKAKTIKRVKKQ